MISFYTSALQHEMNSYEELVRLAKYHGDATALGSISTFHFLMALMGAESSYGTDNVPRFEYSYSRSSIAFKRSKLLQEGYEKWGDLCAMSYGPTQILWIVAKELGYPDHPLNLWSAVVSLPYTCDLLKKNFAKGAHSVEALAASYNAGAGVIAKPKDWPTKYVQKVVGYYGDAMRKWPK